jgi:hypothetical protein
MCVDVQRQRRVRVAHFHHHHWRRLSERVQQRAERPVQRVRTAPGHAGGVCAEALYFWAWPCWSSRAVARRARRPPWSQSPRDQPLRCGLRGAHRAGVHREVHQARRRRPWRRNLHQGSTSTARLRVGVCSSPRRSRGGSNAVRLDARPRGSSGHVKPNTQRIRNSRGEKSRSRSRAQSSRLLGLSTRKRQGNRHGRSRHPLRSMLRRSAKPAPRAVSQRRRGRDAQVW